jgi:CxxC motif-containing protein (DUF1111 family)
MFIALGGIAFAAPAFAEDPAPIACTIDSDGHEDCSTVEPIIVDSTEQPMPIDAPIDVPDCSVDMSACERGVIMYDKNIAVPVSAEVENHDHKTWWDIFTDPNHIAAEIGWTVIQDVLILGLLYGFVFKKCILPKLTKKIHEDIDKEHGIEH